MLSMKTSSAMFPAAVFEEPAMLSAAEVQAHAEATYKRAQSVKHNKTDSEETASALHKLALAVCASAAQCGDRSGVAQHALARVSKNLTMLDAILADTKAGFGSARRRTVERRLLSLQALISLLKIELKISLDERRCGLIERDTRA